MTLYSNRAVRLGVVVGAVMAALAIVAVLVWGAAQRDAPAPATASHSADPHSAPPLPAESSAGNEPTPSAEPTVPLWRVLDERVADVKPPYPANWSEAGRALVDVSGATRTASAWQVGDRVSMQLPQLGVAYEGGIERLDEGLGHSRSARGWATGTNGRERRFVVTVGPTRVLAYIDTAEGPYELVADTRLGWLLPSESMLAGIDFSKPDYIIPEHPAEPDGPAR
ncbi:MAG: hypothetical protein OXM59_04715 [Gammaproteobacteria bacterium]|nr:hypothetical protein [Gammaproteobacteria bacterium]